MRARSSSSPSSSRASFPALVGTAFAPHAVASCAPLALAVASCAPPAFAVTSYARLARVVTAGAARAFAVTAGAARARAVTACAPRAFAVTSCALALAITSCAPLAPDAHPLSAASSSSPSSPSPSSPRPPRELVGGVPGAGSAGSPGGAGAAGDADHCVNDVRARFQALPTAVDSAQYLAANNLGALPSPDYTQAIGDELGYNEHFQALQRVGRSLVVSAGLPRGAPTSQLIVVDMGSHDAEARWSPAPGDGAAVITDADVVSNAFDLDGTLWHAGGFQIEGHVLAVALAGDDATHGEIRFYDVSDLTAPRELSPRITRDHKLYVAALTRLDDGRFLVLAWDDHVMELVASIDDDIEHGLDTATTLIHPADVAGGFEGDGCDGNCGTYQALNFVRGCDGGIFLVGTHNMEKLAPVVPGANIASLYELTWSDAPALSFVESKTFECHDRQCNFAAASGVYVLDEDHLALYSAFHWLQDSGTHLRFNEFAN